MSTKINTLKQLRKGDNGTFLGNKDNELKWLTIADLGVKDAAAITEEINNAIEAAKNQLKIDINTAKFVGPVLSEVGQEDSIDANDLLLVGNAAPYKIFAKVGGALVELGKTDVDLTNYYTKQEVDQKVEDAKSEVLASAGQLAESAKREAVAAAEQDATEKANAAEQRAIGTAQAETTNQIGMLEDRIPDIAKAAAETAKQDAVAEAGRFATGEAERIKNELDPRITALEGKEDKDTKYRLRNFYVRREPAATNAMTGMTIKIPGLNREVDAAILSSLSIYLNGIAQNRTDDISNLFAGREPGTIFIGLTEDLDNQDIVYVQGHYLEEL